jgi:hypothetical protein
LLMILVKIVAMGVKIKNPEGESIGRKVFNKIYPEFQIAAFLPEH